LIWNENLHDLVFIDNNRRSFSEFAKNIRMLPFAAVEAVDPHFAPIRVARFSHIQNDRFQRQSVPLAKTRPKTPSYCGDKRFKHF
jgi:hypothetical protein